MSDKDVGAIRSPRRRLAKGPGRPRYLRAEDLDRLMIMIITLTSELSALRDRVDTHEHLAEQSKTITRSSVENYKLTEERQVDREKMHQEMLKRVFRVLTEEMENIV